MTFGLRNFIHILQLSIILCLLSTNESTAGRRLKISLLHNGTDEFILTDIKGRKVQCATEGQNFCAKHGAKSVDVNGTCPQNQETLYCRCSSTKPTFSLQKERCLKDLDIMRTVLRERNSAGCKFRVVVGTSTATRRCLKSTIPTLITNISYTQRYSICSAHALNDVGHCTIDGNNSFYLNKEGRWRGLWKLEPREKAAGYHGGKLSYVLRELSSARYSGLIISVQVTCLLYRVRGLLLRGQSPPKQIRSCVLLKIAGSRLWSLEPQQMNFTRPNTMNTNRTNQTNHRLREHHVISITSTTSTPSTTLRMPTTPSAADEPADTDGEEIHRVKTAGPLKQLLLVVAAVLSCVLALIVACLLVLALSSRRTRRKTKRREPSTGNPTYERGPDNNIALTTTTAVSHSESSLSAHVVYQPLVENTRPCGDNGRMKLYESLDDIRESLQTHGCFSEFSYQEPIRLKSKTSCLNHTYQTLLPGSVESSRSLQRRQSESSLNTVATGLHAQPGLEMACSKRPRFSSDSEKSGLEDHGQFGVIGTYPSLLFDEKAAVGIELKSKSGKSSCQDFKSGSCLESFYGKMTSQRIRKGDELLKEETGDWEVEAGPEKAINTAPSSCSSFSIEIVRTQGSDTSHNSLHDGSSEGAQIQSLSAQETDVTHGGLHELLSENTHSGILTQENVSPSPTQNGASRDSVHDSTNNLRLSGLVVDTMPESECETCSELSDAMSDQLEVFYYVLEGPYCTCAE